MENKKYYTLREMLTKVSYFIVNITILYFFIRSFYFDCPWDIRILIAAYVICFNIPALIRALIILKNSKYNIPIILLILVLWEGAVFFHRAIYGVVNEYSPLFKIQFIALCLFWLYGVLVAFVKVKVKKEEPSYSTHSWFDNKNTGVFIISVENTSDKTIFNIPIIAPYLWYIGAALNPDLKYSDGYGNMDFKELMYHFNSKDVYIKKINTSCNKEIFDTMSEYYAEYYFTYTNKQIDGRTNQYRIPVHSDDKGMFLNIGTTKELNTKLELHTSLTWPSIPPKTIVSFNFFCDRREIK